MRGYPHPPPSGRAPGISRRRGWIQIRRRTWQDFDFASRVHVRQPHEDLAAIVRRPRHRGTPRARRRADEREGERSRGTLCAATGQPGLQGAEAKYAGLDEPGTSPPHPTHTGGIECSVGRDPAPAEPLSATWWQTGANTVPLLYELQGLHGEKRSTNWCAEATPARGQEKAHALSMGPKRQALVVESHRVQQMSYEQAALIDRQYVRRVHAHGPPSQIPTGRGRWQVIACGVPGILWVQDARVD